MKVNPSREQLSKSLDRRIKHLMIRTLEKFEDMFPDLEDGREGRIFKGDIRNIFNDVMRAQRDEIRDYDIEYRPLKLTDENTLTMTRAFMRSVQKIICGFTASDHPFLEVYGGPDSEKVLHALRREMDAGVVERTEDGFMLLIVGTDVIVDSVLSIMDRYHLHQSVAPEYRIWRDQVINIYRS